MRVLVTGSSGFLGRNVVAALTSQSGFDVVAFDQRPMPDAALPTITGDFCDLVAITDACRGVDAVVHFGGIGDVDVASKSPELAAQVNVVGTTNVAIAAARAGARVIYASTWEVYAPARTDPVDEEHPCGPSHIYGATKLGGELVLTAMHHSEGLPVTTLRLGTGYGPLMRPNAVFRRFADAARAGGPLVVHGSGEQFRQFTHTSDICRAVHLALVADSESTDTFNITSDESTSVRRLAELVAARYDVPVTFGPHRPGDPPSARISAGKAASGLGWRAEMPFDAGLDRLLSELDACQ